MTVKPLNLTLYLVLDPDLCSQSVGIIETALAAVQAGAGIVQLRAPTWKKRRMTECARALKSALTPFHVPLIIDDHADVMLTSAWSSMMSGTWKGVSACLLYTSPSPRDVEESRMPSSA